MGSIIVLGEIKFDGVFLFSFRDFFIVPELKMLIGLEMKLY
jgi:hypothetical protein